MIIKLDLSKLENIVANADKMLLNPDGEKVLLQLLEIESQVEDAVKQARAKIEETALKIDPNFTTIVGDNVRISYVARGAKYFLDEKNINDVPKELYEIKTSFSVNSDAVDKFIKKTGGLPLGINAPERTKSLTITAKKEK